MRAGWKKGSNPFHSDLDLWVGGSIGAWITEEKYFRTRGVATEYLFPEGMTPDEKKAYVEAQWRLK